MSAEMPLGAIRTYARLDPDAAPTFEAWSAAVRAGRTFATSGPVIELSVDGHEPGDVLSLPASGGHLEAQVRARAAQPIIGSRGAGRERARRRPGGRADEPTADLSLTAELEVAAGAWIAARSRSDHRSTRPTARAWRPTPRRCTSRSRIAPSSPRRCRGDPPGHRRDRTMAGDDGRDRRSGAPRRGWRSRSPPAERPSAADRSARPREDA